MNDKPVQIYMSDEMRQNLKVLAKMDNRSVSNYLRQLVSRAVERGIRDGIIKKQ